MPARALRRRGEQAVALLTSHGAAFAAD